jgi:hypothetical protein
MIWFLISPGRAIRALAAVSADMAVDVRWEANGESYHRLMIF